MSWHYTNRNTLKINNMITPMNFIEGKNQPCFMFKSFIFSSGLEKGIVAAFVSYLLPSTQEVTEIENTTLWFGHFVLQCQTRDDVRFDFQREWVALGIHGAQLSEAPSLVLAASNLRIGWINSLLSPFSFLGEKNPQTKKIHPNFLN